MARSTRLAHWQGSPPRLPPSGRQRRRKCSLPRPPTKNDFASPLFTPKHTWFRFTASGEHRLLRIKGCSRFSSDSDDPGKRTSAQLLMDIVYSLFFSNVKFIHAQFDILSAKYEKNCQALKLSSLLLKFHNIVGRAADDRAEFFQRDHRDILALFQRIQRLIVDATFEQLVLRDIFPLHRLP